MRYPPQHKAAAKAKLVDAGGTLVKQAGFAATGIDAIAAAAGVTTGAVYSQFGSKQQMLSAIVENEMERVIAGFRGADGRGLEGAALRKTLARYLSPQHAAHPENGCPIPSLGAEIARADAQTRSVFEEQLTQLIDLIEPGAADRQRAWGIVAQAVGAVLLARAVENPATANEILAAVQSQAQACVR